MPKIYELFDFKNKTTIVTGSSGGIGRGIALRFAEAGANVVLHYHKGDKEAEELEHLIASLNGSCLRLQADVTSEREVASVIEKTVENFGTLDIVINNAGTYPLTPLLEMNRDQWDSVIRTNLTSIFFFTRHAAEIMKEQADGGVIINIASIEGENPAVLHSHYAAAKGGAIMYTKSAALELGTYNIRVNSISPGLIWREGLDTDWPEGVERYTRTAPLGRLGNPFDIADACLFLASPAGSWITGENIRVDGGMGAVTGY